jgi:MFS family permease
MPVEQSETTERVASTSGLSAYRETMRAPGAWPIAFGSLLARLPNGMGAVVLILFAHEATGSFASAGLVAGAFTLGLGATGPLLARRIDRNGSRKVLLAGGLIGSAGFVAVYLLGTAGAGPLAIAGAAAISGGAIPPINGVMRRRWATLVESDRLPTAYAVESILVEIVFIAGPALAGVLAAALGAGDALLVAAGIGVIGAFWFAPRAGISPDGSGPVGEHHWAGALRSRTVRVLLAAGIPMGAGIGVLDVVLPAFGAAHGNAALGGPFAAALAFGSLLGGIALGGRPDSFGPPGRAMLWLALLQGLTCIPILLCGGVAEMFFAAAVAGLCWAPLVTARNRLVQLAADPLTVTEAFTWVGLSGYVGASMASALTGPLVNAHGWRAGAVLACLVPVLGGLVGLFGGAARTSPP